MFYIIKNIFYKKNAKSCYDSEKSTKSYILSSGATSKQVDKCKEALYSDASYINVVHCLGKELGKKIEIN